MDELKLSDAHAQRVGRLFADLMLTLAEEGVAGAESAEAICDLWKATAGKASPSGLELSSETLAHGVGGVAVALAGQLVSERRAAGCAGASVAAVWQEVAQALDPACSATETAGGTIDIR